MTFQGKAAAKFAEENKQGVDASPEEKGTFGKQAVNRRDKTGHSVNRKHPDGGVAGQCKVFFVKGMKTGKQDFEAPSQSAAHDKFFFHRKSMGLKRRFYSENVL